MESIQEAENCGGLASWQNQPIQSRQLIRLAHLDGVRAGLGERLGVSSKIALNCKHSDHGAFRSMKPSNLFLTCSLFLEPEAIYREPTLFSAEFRAIQIKQRVFERLLLTCRFCQSVAPSLAS